MPPVDDAADNSIEGLVFDWRLVEGGDALVSLEGVDEAGHATLSGLKAGKTRLVMEMYGIGTLIIPVEVRERPKRIRSQSRNLSLRLHPSPSPSPQRRMGRTLPSRSCSLQRTRL